jgi:glycerol-3-phosphate O-acyltransferase
MKRETFIFKSQSQVTTHESGEKKTTETIEHEAFVSVEINAAAAARSMTVCVALRLISLSCRCQIGKRKA